MHSLGDEAGICLKKLIGPLNNRGQELSRQKETGPYIQHSCLWQLSSNCSYLSGQHLLLVVLVVPGFAVCFHFKDSSLSCGSWCHGYNLVNMSLTSPPGVSVSVRPTHSIWLQNLLSMAMRKKPQLCYHVMTALYSWHSPLTEISFVSALLCFSDCFCSWLKLSRVRGLWQGCVARTIELVIVFWVMPRFIVY